MLRKQASVSLSYIFSGGYWQRFLQSTIISCVSPEKKATYFVAVLCAV
jgi:hypothetical protein